MLSTYWCFLCPLIRSQDHPTEGRFILWHRKYDLLHYNDVTMSAMVSQSLASRFFTLFRGRSKKTSKLRVTGLCEGNSPVTGDFPTQRASDAENVSIWWRHHVIESALCIITLFLADLMCRSYHAINDKNLCNSQKWLLCIFSFPSLLGASLAHLDRPSDVSIIRSISI